MAKAKQRQLFEDTQAAADDGAAAAYAEVVFPRPLFQSFTYAVPAESLAEIVVGRRVRAPLGRGNRATIGYCVGLATEAPVSAGVKWLLGPADDRVLVGAPMLALARWIAEHYVCPLGQVLEAVVPRAVKDRAGGRWTIYLSPVVPSPAEAAVAPATAEIIAAKSADGEAGDLAHPALPPARTPAAKLSVGQQRVYEYLVQAGKPLAVDDVRSHIRCSSDMIKALKEKGFLNTEKRWLAKRAAQAPARLWRDPLPLNDAQAAALASIVKAVREGTPSTFLLHGVTGSGKTEVYLQSIADCVAGGREAIVLVPEIALTPQTIGRFGERFSHIAVLHSHMSDVERAKSWREIAAGDVQVAIGARSAVFAPFPNLGLIVLDEEHENTFKQDNAPRYHAREAAIARGRLEGFPVVLGSATPSLETYARATEGEYEYLRLPQRATGLALPKVELVDLREEFRRGAGLRLVSRPLREAMAKALAAGGQVILLLNRRGFSASLFCPACGQAVRCAHCDVALTFHKSLNALLCHQCDTDRPAPERCPQCRRESLRFVGAGTQRLEDEVRATFPGVAVDRMDSDTMRSLDRYHEVLGRFGSATTRILLGTQMIAKGLDFPNVHLVGVVSADTSRHVPDFRAGERTFQLIAQVAGRAGRGKDPGRVLVQTYEPTDECVLLASKHDYLRYADLELRNRRAADYPPYGRLTRLLVRSTSEENARQGARSLADGVAAQLTMLDLKGRLLGPAVCPVARIKDCFRFHLQLQTARGLKLDAVIRPVLAAWTPPGDCEAAVDVDPVNML